MFKFHSISEKYEKRGRCVLWLRFKKQLNKSVVSQYFLVLRNVLEGI